MDYKGVRKVEVEEKGKNGGGEERGKGEEEGKKDKNYDFQPSNDNLDKKSKLQREEDGIKNTEDEGSISNWHVFNDEYIESKKSNDYSSNSFRSNNNEGQAGAELCQAQHNQVAS